MTMNQANIYMFKDNNRSTRKRFLLLTLNMFTPFLEFLLLTLNKEILAGKQLVKFEYKVISWNVSLTWCGLKK